MRTSILAIAWAAVAVGAAEPGTVLPLGDFGSGKDRFRGDIVADRDVLRQGHASGRIDNKGTRWVTASRRIEGVQHDFRELRFWVRSTDARGLAVRLTDATGQSHQQRVSFDPNGEWQSIRITRFDGGTRYEAWGGAADHQWHPPAQGLAFVLEKGSFSGDKATVWIDGVEAVLDPDPVYPDCVLNLTTPGNVFTAAEPVAVTVTTRADRVEWSATDFWGDPAGEGSAAASNHVAVIAPAFGRNGYFLLRLRPMAGDQSLGEAYTSVAVIPPVMPGDRSHSPFGVMTHFAQGMDPDILPLIAKAGIASIRDEHYWAQVEKTANVYAFPERSDAYMAACASNGLRPLIEMTFENRLYDGGQTPYTPEGCDAYGRYGQAILNHYGAQVPWLEVWNEYNGSWCKGPATNDRPRYYALMLKHAYARIKEVRPDVRVLGGAAAVIPMPYLEGLFAQGGLDSMDALVLHPYRSQPEGVDVDVGDVQALIRRYNGGKDKPIWVTETGRLDRDEYAWEEGRQMFEKGRRGVARYLPRQYALLLSRNVEKIFWYLCRDYQNFVTMGLLRSADDAMGRYAVAPAYVAYATFIRQLDGARFVERVPTASRFTYLERFQRGTQEVYVCWATQPDSVAFRAEGPVTAVDLMGEPRTLTPQGGVIALTLGEDAWYLTGRLDPLGGTGRFPVAAVQSVDLMAEPSIRVGGVGAAPAELGIGGRTCRVSAPDGRVVVAGVDTTTPGTHPLRYSLSVDGHACAAGTVLLRVVDPVEFRGTPRLADLSTVGFALRNASPGQAYTLTGLVWTVGGVTRAAAVNGVLAAGGGLDGCLPIPAGVPYAEQSGRVVAQFDGRRPAESEAAFAYGPCRRLAVTVDGALDEWRDVPAIDMRAMGRAWGGGTNVAAPAVRVAWDETCLYLAVTSSVSAGTAPCLLRFAVAPDYAGVWRERLEPAGWTEWGLNLADGAGRLACTMGPGDTGTQVKVMRGDKAVQAEVAIPWKDLAPAAPAAGAFRLALVASPVSEQGNAACWIEWGSGIAMGKTPDGFRIMHLEDAGGAGSEPGQPVVTPTAATVREPAGEVRTVADSETEFSRVQGRDHWYYGYYAGTGRGHGDGHAPLGPYTDDDFVELEQVQTAWGYSWAAPGIKYLTVGLLGAHPGLLDGRPVWAVRRWVSTIDGRVRITGTLHCYEKKSDGVGLRVIVDGVQQYAITAGMAGGVPLRTLDVVVPVHAGSMLDVALTPGQGINTLYDASVTTFTIQCLPPAGPAAPELP